MIIQNLNPFEPRHEISNNVVCATSKASDQPALTRSLIKAFACRLNIYGRITIWSSLTYKKVVQARLSLHMSKCHSVGNHMSRLFRLKGVQMIRSSILLQGNLH